MNYLNYEEKVRQDNDKHQKKVLSYYLQFFKDNNKILDLACGKGNFLELLNDRGIGVDNDKSICEYVKKKGLKIVQEDIITFLESTKETFDGIMMSHIIEHFDIKTASKVIGLIYEHLNKKGVLVIVTPNAESITAHLYFDKDPTHVRFYPHQLIRFIAEEVGFKFKQNGGNPYSKAKIWEEISFKDLKKKNSGVDEISKLFDLSKLPKHNNEEINDLKVTINKLIKKVNILEKFILNPMDVYVVMIK